LLFLGTGLANKTLAQNIWFEFDKYLNTVTYTVRLLEMATGDNRGIFTAQVSWAEAAVLLDACIEQVLAEQALEQQRYTLRRKGM
jgi:hypothetical protein